MSNPVVLGFIVRSGVFPSFALIIIRHNDDIVALYPRGERQIIDIASEEQLSVHSKHFIEYKPNGGREEFVIPKYAFAVSRDEVLFLEANELREVLVDRANKANDVNTAVTYSEAAENLLLFA